MLHYCTLTPVLKLQIPDRDRFRHAIIPPPCVVPTGQAPASSITEAEIFLHSLPVHPQAVSFITVAQPDLGAKSITQLSRL
jgi:hypothetical protein